MAEFQLTQEQKIAQSFDRHLAVNANAGSGKTSVLVRRFINILLENNKNVFSGDCFKDLRVKPNEIVAITFTRKASSEMLAKVVARIEKIIESSEKPSELRYLRFIREKLTNARISTIHSFCIELLKSFPIEAQVSPAFIEIPIPDLVKIKKDAVLSVFEDWLESNDDKKEKINTLFRAISKYNLEELISAILGKGEIFESLKLFYNQTSDEILKLRDDETKKVCVRILEGVENLSIIFSSVNPPVAHKLYVENAKEMYEQIISEVAKNTFSDFSNSKSFIYNTNELIGKLYTKSGTLRVKEIQKGISDTSIIENANKLYSDYFNDLTKLIEMLGNSDFDELMVKYASWLIELADEVFSVVTEQKERMDALDFDDLILKTVQLLRNPEVATKVRSKIKYLLVDEFQDTNDAQYEIIKLLVPELAEHSFDSGVNLFIVGDDKQSIYGFRNADVRVFNQARNDIKLLNESLLKEGKISREITSQGEKIISDNPNNTLGNISLTSTFRLQPVLASFVNLVCGNLMAVEESSFDVKYSKLTCAKNVPLVTDIKLTEDNGSPATKKAGSVTFLLAEKKYVPKGEAEEDSDEESESPHEAELLAKHLIKIIESDSPIQVSDAKEGYRNVLYKDIAILSRKRGQFSALIRAFLDNKIPYIINSGSGFYSSQEVMDVISYLNFLTNPQDDLSVSGLLKSLFFKLTDNELFIISKQKKDCSLWENLESYCIANPVKDIKETDSAHRAFNILSDLKLFSSSQTVSQNIFRLLEITAWFGSISNEAGRHQMTANIDKLIQLARDFENRGFRSLHEFVEYLNFISEASLQESEAVHISGRNAVNILTIHASKGLEFPIVVLYSINVQSGKNSSFNISKETGISFSMNVNLQDRIWTKINTPLNYFSNLNQKLIEKAEEKRLLYVAMTRAIDHLVITATLKQKSSGSHKMLGLFALIMDGLKKYPESLLSDDYLILEDVLPVLKNNSLEYLPIKYCLESIKNVEPLPIPADTNEIEEHSPLMLNMELTSEPSGESFSATRIMTFQNDKEDYIKKYILGITNDTEFSMRTTVDDDGNIIHISDEIPANEIGTIIHNLMEKCNDWVSDEAIPDSKNLTELIEQNIGTNKTISTELKNEIMNNCLNVVSTKLFKTELKAVLDGRREYELTIPLSEDTFTAKIDLLIKRNDGKYQIWDWKTNKIASMEKREDLVRHYEIQLKSYCYFLMLMYPEQSSFTAKLLFTRLARDNSPDSDWTNDLTWTKDELIEFGDELLNEVSKIKKILTFE